MENKLIQETSNKVFDKVEKWDAFLELIKRKRQLEQYWYGNFSTCLLKLFNDKNQENESKWKCDKISNHRLYWSLKTSKDFGEASLSIWFEEGRISLWSNSGNFDIPEQNNLLYSNEKFKSIKAFFKKIDLLQNSSKDNPNLLEFQPEIIIDNNTVIEDNMYWYFGNKTKDFADKILEYILTITNEENTELLTELHDETQLY